MKFESGVKRENIIGEMVFSLQMMNLFNFIQFYSLFVNSD